MAHARKIDHSNHDDELEASAQSYYPELSQVLLKRQKELVERQEAARANLEEQRMTSPGDDADASVLDTSADYFLRMANGHERELGEINDAFDRMTRGSYGICGTCENPIPVERLRRLPYAKLCIECQSIAEKGRVTSLPRQTPPKL